MCNRVHIVAVAAAVIVYASTTAADTFFLVDNAQNLFITGSTQDPANANVLSQLGGGSWFDLSPGNTPDSIFATNVTNITALNTLDGSVMWVLPTDRQVRSIAYNWETNILYGLPQTAPNELFTIDLSTGDTTVVGPLDVSATPVQTFGMGYDPVLGMLLVVTGQGNLFAVDPLTAESTLIGNTGHSHLFDIAYNPGDGLMYVTSAADDSLYTVDRQTAALTLVGGPYAHSTLGTGLAFAIPGTTDLAVNFDIRPGSCPNPINPKSKGVLPAAILGDGSFDVSLIDPATLVLRRADGIGGSVSPLSGPPGPGIKIDDVATPFDGTDLCDCHVEGPDGVSDLTMKFSTQALLTALELDGVSAGETIELRIEGELTDGTPFSGTDCVVVVGIGNLVNMLGALGTHAPTGGAYDLNRDGIVDEIDLFILIDVLIDR